eukprot:GILJ01008818.1.p1 GENE.GILJ01008818.1~~GILJ01008818.1.p1  ORF type:complete len:105 (-),score=14.73 GILJ01008818.1:96-410(-)
MVDKKKAAIKEMEQRAASRHANEIQRQTRIAEEHKKAAGSAGILDSYKKRWVRTPLLNESQDKRRQCYWSFCKTLIVLLLAIAVVLGVLLYVYWDPIVAWFKSR